MSNEIEFCYKFQPLFELLEPNNYPEVDTVIMTGGRGSFKSFTVSCFTLTALVQHEWFWLIPLIDVTCPTMKTEN